MKEQKLQVHDIVIIGGGIAGMLTAIQAEIYNLNSILIESSNKLGGLLAKEYSDIIINTPLMGNVVSKDLIKNLENKIDPNFVDIKLNTLALQIGNEENILFVKTDKDVFYCKNIVIAVGEGYYVPKIPPSIVGLQKAIKDGKADLFIRDINEYTRRNVVILGSNTETLLSAMLISKVAESVTVINNTHFYRTSDDLIKDVQNEKIELINDCEVFSISDNINKLTLLKDGYTGYINFDKLLCFFGFKRDFSIMEKWKPNVWFENKTFQKGDNKSLKGVHGVGNCISYLGKTNSISAILGEADGVIQQCYKRVYGSEAKVRYEKIKYE